MGNRISKAIETNNERRAKKEQRRQQAVANTPSPTVSGVSASVSIQRSSRPAILDLHQARFGSSPSNKSNKSNKSVASPTREESGDFAWVNKEFNIERRGSGSGSSGEKERRKLLFNNHVPRDNDRMQRQHYLLKYALKGNHTTPCENPSRILDIGCGSGIWSIEMAQQYPQAEAIGFDIAPPSVDVPGLRNLKFVQGDLWNDFEFADDTFDLVYQRAMGTIIPCDAWEAYFHEVWRIMAPGGWLQLVEIDLLFKSPGPALELINEKVITAFTANGFDPLFAKFLPDHLQTAGFVNISKKTIDIPSGEWSSDPDLKRCGFINKGSQTALFKIMRTWFVEDLGVKGEDYDRAVAEALVEFEEYQGYKTWTILIAQKPYDE